MTVDEIGGMRWVFPSPYGDKFQRHNHSIDYIRGLSFRPLRG